VDSDEEEVWFDWLRRAGFDCNVCVFGADVDLESWRSCGVLEKA
jgi:hypothetical protein